VKNARAKKNRVEDVDSLRRQLVKEIRYSTSLEKILMQQGIDPLAPGSEGLEAEQGRPAGDSNPGRSPVSVPTEAAGKNSGPRRPAASAGKRGRP